MSELFREVSQKIATRPGGYTRILKTGIRHGDNSEMCIIELVDYNENMLKEPKAKKARATRRGRGGKKAEAQPAEETAQTVEAQPAEVKAETEAAPAAE